MIERARIDGLGICILLTATLLLRWLVEPSSTLKGRRRNACRAAGSGRIGPSTFQASVEVAAGSGS
jgi:hypothetical protein